MNKNEYIKRLAQTLDPYEIPNKYDIMADYEQIVDEILLDNENDFNKVIDKLGYPEILGIEIADELGYENKRKSNQYTGSHKNTFEKKRHKSNAIWNIILGFFYIVQTLLSIKLVAIISLLLYFGVNSTIDFKVIENRGNNVEFIVNVCKKDKCNTYRTNFNREIKYSYHNDDYDDSNGIQTTKEFVSADSFPIGAIFVVCSGVLSILLWLNYIIIYKNVRRVTSKNDEYNRRRNYD